MVVLATPAWPIEAPFWNTSTLSPTVSPVSRTETAPGHSGPTTTGAGGGCARPTFTGAEVASFTSGRHFGKAWDAVTVSFGLSAGTLKYSAETTKAAVAVGPAVRVNVTSAPGITPDTVTEPAQA